VNRVETAIVLAAGAGTRLRELAESKPLCPVGGQTLLEHALTGLAVAGMKRVIVVTGYRAEAIEQVIAQRDWPAEIVTVRSADWRMPNGVSVLAAAPLLDGAPALLVMCDHLVDPPLYAHVAAAGPGAGLRLGVDRRLGHPWVDPLDVTCVETLGHRIVAIGKELEPHNAYDTGVFAIGPALFAALASLEAPSLTEGVRILAAQGTAEVVECSQFDWIDVDDEPAHRAAAAYLASRRNPVAV
jgi:choline kinase